MQRILKIVKRLRLEQAPRRYFILGGAFLGAPLLIPVVLLATHTISRILPHSNMSQINSLAANIIEHKDTAHEASTPASGAIDQSSGGQSSGAIGHMPSGAEVLPSRAFAGPSQYPPSGFRAYGIVAFTSDAVPENYNRYLAICEAYSAQLPIYSEIHTHMADQMVTIWPVMRDRIANLLNKSAHRVSPSSIQFFCRKAIGSYDLPTAQLAIDDARNSGASLDGVGPFLLAWSPSTQIGKPKVPVLVLNLSNVDNYGQAQQIFLDWSKYIVENPSLWKKGWSFEKLRIVIRLFADRYGGKVFRLFGGSGS